ncbi:MAG: hypothetical protein PHF11_05170 [Candidatus Omnitrophica bacterium]|nr:hypothetical protein [Candidatus Omnitrophota bacterium]
MLGTEKKKTNEAICGMEHMCRDLFNEWLQDLTVDEKQVWLWNSLVEMQKVKQRRSCQG